MSMLSSHHKEILVFFKAVRGNTSEFSFTNHESREEKLLDSILDSGIERIYQKDLAKEFKTSTENIGRTIRKNLNHHLVDFSDKFEIYPPIQLYFNTEEAKGPGGHFACCDLPTNNVKSDKFINIKDLKVMLEAVRQRLEIVFQSKDKLKLSKPTITKLGEGRSPLSFKYRWPKKIYGRNKEKEQLLEFVNCKDEKLLWWAITGKGGSGKSRLALELCYQLEKDWYTGFLMDPKQIDVLSDWKPKQPTLIVIDYTYEKSKKLGECIINYMYENSKQWDFPVRILFLERYAKSEAFRRFCFPDPDIIDDSLLYRYSTNNDKSRFLELKSLNDKAIDSITITVFKRKKGKDARPSGEALQTIRTFLKEKVRDNNPLYAMILAEACAENEKIQEWDISDLLGWHLGHTRKIWKKAGIDETNDLDRKRINLLTLATMTNGVNIRSIKYDECLKFILDGTEITDILPTKREFEESKYQLLCDNEVVKELGPMTPDILGEYFVIDRWKSGIAEECDIELLIKIAWQYDSWEMSDFISRAVIDFQSDVLSDRVIDLIGSEDVTFERAMLLRNLISLYSVAGSDDRVINCYKQIKDISRKGQLRNIGISLMFIQSTYNIATFYGENGEIEKAINHYESIELMWNKDWQRNKDLSLILSWAVIQLTYYMNQMENHKKVINYYKYIDALWTSRYQSDKEITLSVANAACNLASYYGKIGKSNEVIYYYKRIEKFWKRSHKNDKEVTLFLIKASATTMYFLDTVRYNDIIMKCHNQIKKLWSKDCQVEKDLILCVANAADTLANAFVATKQFDKAIECSWDFNRVWESKYRKDKDVTLLLSHIAFGLVSAYGSVGDLGKAVEYYGCIEELWNNGCQRHKDVSTCLVNAACNLTIFYGEAKMLTKVIEYYEIVEKLWSSYWHEDKDVTLVLVKMAHNLIVAYGHAGQLDKKVECYAHIDSLVINHKNDINVMTWLSNAARVLLCEAD